MHWERVGGAGNAKKKKKKKPIACLGRDRGFLVAIECRKCQEQAATGFESR